MRVELYEDNAGGLVLSVGQRAWAGLENTGSSFAEDAAAALAGETSDWTVQELQEGDLVRLRGEGNLVAVYEPPDGEVVIVERPGLSASRYIGVPYEG